MSDWMEILGRSERREKGDKMHEEISIRNLIMEMAGSTQSESMGRFGSRLVQRAQALHDAHAGDAHGGEDAGENAEGGSGEGGGAEHLRGHFK